MAIEFSLEFDGISVSEDLLGRGSRASLRYTARCTAGETEQQVRESLKMIAPQMYENLLLSGAEIVSMVADNPGDRVYHTEATYSKPEDKEPPKPTDESTVVLELRSAGGTTINRLFSQALIQEVSVNASFDFAGTEAEKLIGLKASDPDNSTTLDAVGVPFKQNGTQLTVHAWKSPATISGGYLQLLADAADRMVVNAGIYKGFEGGSLQFVDWTATANAGTNPGWTFSFVFDYSRKVLPDIPGLPPFTSSKLGHEYLDVLYMPKLIAAKNIMIPVPVRAAIHKIYDTEHFATFFGI